MPPIPKTLTDGDTAFEPPACEPLICSLSPSLLERRLAESERLLTGQLLTLERRDYRLRLTFRPNRRTRPKLERFLEQERACCPFLTGRIESAEAGLTLDLTVEPGGEGILAEIERIAQACLPPARPLRIGEVACRAGVNVQTLRYYERRGLLNPERRHTGQREYEENAIRLVRSIKAAQSLGFSLTEIEELLQITNGGPGNPTRLSERAQAKMAEIDQRIARLQAIRASLADIVAHECDSLTNCACGDDCPIDTEEERSDAHIAA